MDVSERTYKINAAEVERLRTNKGLSLERLAMKSGVHVKTIKRWMRGTPVFIKNIKKLADVLEVTPEILIEKQDNSHPVQATDETDAKLSDASGEKITSSLSEAKSGGIDYFRATFEIVTPESTSKSEVVIPLNEENRTQYIKAFYAFMKSLSISLMTMFSLLSSFGIILWITRGITGMIFWREWGPRAASSDEKNIAYMFKQMVISITVGVLIVWVLLRCAVYTIRETVILYALPAWHRLRGDSSTEDHGATRKLD